MVGFEAELAVPSYGPRHRKLTYKTHPKRIGNRLGAFLDGGVPYDTDIGGKDDVSAGRAPFRLDADHSGAVSREPVINALKAEGHIEGKAKEPRTNLEYVTRPIQELAANSNSELASVAQAVQSHMKATVAAGTSGQMDRIRPPAATKYWTGVPLDLMQNWLKGAPNHDRSMRAARSFLQGLTGEVYLQATVGIIPSGVQEFVADSLVPPQQGVDVHVEAPTKARNLLFAAVNEEIARLQKQKWFIEGTANISAVAKKAFTGALWICFSYIVGDTVHQTSGGTTSTVKNAVPFLVKNADEGAMVAALKRTGFKPSDELLAKIATFFDSSKYARIDYWTKAGGGTAQGEGKLKKALKPRPGVKERLIDGTRKEFIDFMLSSNPEVDISKHFGVVVGKKLPGYDILPKKTGGVLVRQRTRWQKAIPLEYRWIKGRYPVDAVPGAMQTIVERVRKANLSDLPEKKRRKVLEQVEK